jgi:transcriptional regulator with XRE-family HTH domain
LPARHFSQAKVPLEEIIMAPNRRLKQVRELRGWSQAKVAELIGTDATTVSRWERGLFLPTPYFRERLCELFGKNAEELGLLEASNSSHLEDGTGFSSLYPHAESGSSSQAGTATRGEMIALKPRTLPEDVDTFTYILQRSSQEQQAYMLWEHAYVQALQDQRAEAQRLGQASVNVFEQVKHPNAAVVRAWLNQQGLLSAPLPGSIDPVLPSAIQHKRSSRPWLRVSGAGVFVVLVLVGGLLLSNFISNRPNISTSSNVNYIPQAVKESNTPATAHHVSSTVPAQSNSTHVVHKTDPTPSSRPISPTPSPLITPVSTSATASTSTSAIASAPAAKSSIMATITPAQLKPDACNSDGMGYRCTITLAVYANTQENISWQASSSGIPVDFNSAHGTISTGTTAQEIVYIDTKACNQNGTLSFAFSASSSTQPTSVSVPWGC